MFAETSRDSNKPVNNYLYVPSFYFTTKGNLQELVLNWWYAHWCEPQFSKMYFTWVVRWGMSLCIFYSKVVVKVLTNTVNNTFTTFIIY